MMKKLTALLVCLSLLCSMTLASADVPAGWKEYRIPDSVRTVWLPADFIVDKSITRNLYDSGTSGTLTGLSTDRDSVLIVLPLEEDYEAPNAFERMLINWVLPLFLPLMDTDEFSFDDVYTVNVAAKKPYMVLTGINASGDVHIVCYIPLYDGAEYSVYYATNGDAATQEEHDMLMDVIRSIK